MKEKIYNWQKITLWIIGILTFVAVTVNTFGKEFNVGYFIDLLTAIGINILILLALFKGGNWIYQTTRKNGKSQKKIIISIIIGIIVLTIIGIFIWQLLEYERTEKKYEACLDRCDISYPKINNTQADYITRFIASQKNKECKISCREKYGK